MIFIQLFFYKMNLRCPGMRFIHPFSKTNILIINDFTKNIDEVSCLLVELFFLAI